MDLSRFQVIQLVQKVPEYQAVSIQSKVRVLISATMRKMIHPKIQVLVVE